MIEHYSPLLTSIKTMFGYKTSAFLGSSITIAGTITATREFLNQDYLGVSNWLLAIVSLLIIADWLIGSIASHKKAVEAKLLMDKVEYAKYKYSSIKISHTLFKFLSLWFWLMLSDSAVNQVIDVPILEGLLSTIAIIPVLLFGFREYISIGEGIETINGEKPYLFILSEKIFEILQFKFLNKLK